MIRTDLGIATAYAEAVSKGYTGTRDEFGQMFADFGKTAEKVTEDKKAVEQMKASVEETKNSVDTTAAEFGQNVADKTAEAKAAITEHANTEKELATAAISEAKDVATGAITEAQTSATDAIASAKDSATAEIAKKGTDTLATIPEDYTTLTKEVGSLNEDLGKLDESVKKKIEPNKTTFFDYVEKIHESANLFNVQDTTVNSDGLTITIKDGNIKCEGVYNLSYNKSIDTGATISLQKGEYDVSAWNGSGEFDVDLVRANETKRVNCKGAIHTTIKLTSDATYSIKVRCTPSFSSGSCDLMIVKGLSKPLVYEKWFETYSTFSNESVKKSVLPAYRKFYGKRIVTIGDSIMHGDGNDYYGIGDILAERNGMKLSDYSEGGATISFRQDKASASDEWSKGQNIQYQATKMLVNETEKPCVVLIDGQTNDINYVSGSEEPQQALGTVTTSYTSFSSNENFCGGLEKIFSDIKKSMDGCANHIHTST